MDEEDPTSATIKATKTGTVTVTASVYEEGAIQATCTKEITITVKAYVDTFTLDKDKVTLYSNCEDGHHTTTLTATVNENAYDKTVAWSSSDDKVATVDENGKVTAVGKGTATITATTNGTNKDGEKVTATCEVTVLTHPTSVEVSADDTTVYLDVKDSNAKLTATVTPADSSYREIKWTIDDEEKAELLVDNNDSTMAYVVGKAEGEVTVTASVYEGESENATCSNTITITVTNKGFNDVDEGTDHASNISWLAENGITEGWINDDGTRSFKPYNDVARADMAAFLQRLAGNVFGDENALNYVPTDEDWDKFTDVSSDGEYHQASILWLADKEITKGWEDGTFRPESYVTRADMAAFIRRLASKYEISDAKTWEPTEEDWEVFSDVTEGEDYHQEDILWLYHAGISKGWEESDGSKTYRPFDTVKRCDMAAFLQRLADLASENQ